MKMLGSVACALVLVTAASLFGCNRGSKRGEEGEEAAQDSDMEESEPVKPRKPRPAQPAGGEADEPPARPARSGFVECDIYVETFEKYMACDKIPQSSKDAAKPSMDALKQSCTTLSNPNIPEDVKKQTAKTYVEGAATLKKGADALGCKL
jgi:hypothetical protein